MSHLDYPHRDYGNDHSLYDWSYSGRRAPVFLDDGTKVSAFIVVPLEFFPLNPSGIPFKHPGAMVTPYPDLRHYTTRDYGNRIGIFRILKVLEEAGLRAVVPVNAAVVERYPSLIERIADAGHEIAAHGVSTDHIHHDGLTEAQESDYITATLAVFRKHGFVPTTWMSPARNQSYRTMDLLAKHGLTVCLDWEMDQRPIKMKTSSGSVTSLPNSFELNDFNLLLTKRQSEDAWRDQIIEAGDYLASEYKRFGSQVFGFTLTPYVVGLPFRTLALQEAIKGLQTIDGLKIQTAGEIVEAWSGQVRTAEKGELVTARTIQGETD
mgnify:CR=1 FL=1